MALPEVGSPSSRAPTCFTDANEHMPTLVGGASATGPSAGSLAGIGCMAGAGAGAAGGWADTTRAGTTLRPAPAPAAPLAPRWQAVSASERAMRAIVGPRIV